MTWRIWSPVGRCSSSNASFENEFQLRCRFCFARKAALLHPRESNSASYCLIATARVLAADRVDLLWWNREHDLVHAEAGVGRPADRALALREAVDDDGSDGTLAKPARRSWSVSRLEARTRVIPRFDSGTWDRRHGSIGRCHRGRPQAPAARLRTRRAPARRPRARPAAR
jgi:hypothetical protein